jgi:hypothetical protein
MTTSFDRDTSGELTCSLESVHTTKDLAATKLGPRGTAWAVGQNARLLERRGAIWQRVPIEGLADNFIALDMTATSVLVLSEDGTLIENPL